ncbi:MBL fold metallo-hydrolase [Eubacteriales bacterium OttesenSCG-928-N14]|nr:MBL fold metallo-hydrolase [Eubacteriales bacterium OttesenSCG-928-N14]
MITQKIKTRSTVFTYAPSKAWDLHLHLIEAQHRNYVIDTGLGSGSVQPILQLLEADDKPTVVINTHHHWDHLWGNCCFADCVIVAHRRCYELLNEHWDVMIEENSAMADGLVERVLPNVLFEDMLYFADDRIRVFYTPGHTEDGISVLDEVDGVLNAGDSIGDTPDEIVPWLDCSRQVYRDTLLRFGAYDFDVCISGHNVIQGGDIMQRILAKLDQE